MLLPLRFTRCPGSHEPWVSSHLLRLLLGIFLERHDIVGIDLHIATRQAQHLATVNHLNFHGFRIIVQMRSYGPLR